MRPFFLSMTLAACVAMPACNKPAAGPTIPASLPTPVSVTLEQYDKIEIGMTLQDVEAILGPATSTMEQETRLSGGRVEKEVTVANWGGVKVYMTVSKDPQTEKERWIQVQLTANKVTNKRQQGLK